MNPRYTLWTVVEILTAPIRLAVLFIYPPWVCIIWGHDVSKDPWHKDAADKPMYRCIHCDKTWPHDSNDVYTPTERYEQMRQ